MRTGSLVVVAAVIAGACSGGKQTADGVAPDGSAGSVTFHLVVPITEVFCDEFTCATGFPQHLRISTSAGQPLALQAAYNCTTSCSSANVCLNQCPNLICDISQGSEGDTSSAESGSNGPYATCSGAGEEVRQVRRSSRARRRLGISETRPRDIGQLIDVESRFSER